MRNDFKGQRLLRSPQAALVLNRDSELWYMGPRPVGRNLEFTEEKSTSSLRPPFSKQSLLSERVILFLLVFVLPLLYLSHQIWWDPNSSFLPFERRAQWVFHPVQEIVDPFHRPVSRPVTFRLDFQVDEEYLSGRKTPLQLRAFRTVREVRLNGREISLNDSRYWKKFRTYDTSKWLERGLNTLEVTVVNREGIPGLMVEEPLPARTPGSWRAAFDSDPLGLRPVVGADLTGPPEPLNELVGRDPGPFLGWIRELGLTPLIPFWLISWSVMILLACVQLWRGKLACPPEASKRAFRYSAGAATLILFLGLFWSLSNASGLPPERSPFDFQQHVDYIKHVAEVELLAEPTDGFQMYQPPLYYWLAACLTGGREESLKRLQWLGAIAGWSLALISWLLVRRLLPGQPVSQVVAVLFVVCLPMVLYTSPLVTNEVFAASLTALAFYWLVVSTEDAGNWLKVLAAGVFAGLAMLAKYSALFVLSAGCLWFLGRWALRKGGNGRRAILLYAGSALLVCGWLYARNLVFYGDPFIMAGEKASGFWYVQQPTYRSAGFYSRFGSAFFHHPERAPWISFGDGHYASQWGDLFRIFLEAGDSQAYFWLSVALLLAFPATCAIGLGLFLSLRVCWRRAFGKGRDLIFLVIPVWTFLALVSYSIELPFVSVIKAFFYLSLVPLLAVHLVRGRLLIYDLLRPLGWVHDGSLLAVCVISVWLYS